MRRTPFLRFPLAGVIGLTLLVALWAGLLRLGWAWPSPQASWVGDHGPLMVSGFLGTLIALERAIALANRPAYLAPLLGVIGALALILGLPETVGALLLTLSSAGLVLINIIIVRRYVALHSVTLLFGALSLLLGNSLGLAGRPVPTITPWWIAFLILTIVGERLELSRVSRPSRLAIRLFAAIVALLILSLFLSLVSFAAGVRLMNLAYISLALWLLRYDIARKTVRRPGLTRFVAVNMLLGYLWLAAGGLIGLRHAGIMAGPAYDAWLHAIFLGFVFGMIFAHALLIFPAISGLTIPFHRLFYGPVILLQLGLLMRVGGDLAGGFALRRWGGLMNGLAILWFLLQIVILAARERSRQNHAQSRAGFRSPAQEHTD